MDSSDSHRLKVLSVGSNPISAFLSWRLTASNAADVSLVWKAQYDIVFNYGVSFKSDQLGSQRFRPFQVVKAVDDIALPPGGYDYVILCVKALPDVYDMAAVIESVVTPGHTCIVVNTSVGLGIESYVGDAFKENVVLSLVCDTIVNQTGPAEFEHCGKTPAQFWIGPSHLAVSRSAALVDDMVESFALTLEAGAVKCVVSRNIRQQQWEKSIGPIAFHPLSVVLEEPNHMALISTPRVLSTISGIIGELMQIAKSQSCAFDASFPQSVVDSMIACTKQSSMFQDYAAKRPMEIEVMISNPLKMADAAGLKAPRLEMMYILLSRLNKVNQTRSAPPTPSPSPPQSQPSIPRQSSLPPSTTAAAARRPPPPSANGYANRRQPPSQAAPARPAQAGPPNGYKPSLSRKSSAEGFEEFSNVVAYANGVNSPPMRSGQFASGPSLQDLTLRERELELRQRELMLREREMMAGRRGARPSLPPRSHTVGAEQDADYFSQMVPPQGPYSDVDMMSVTSRRTRRTGSFARGSEAAAANPQRVRPQRIVSTEPDLGSSSLDYYESMVIDSSMMGYTSDRYHSVDRKVLQDNSRANSMSSNIYRPAAPASAGAPPPASPRWRNAPPQHEPPMVDVRSLRSMAGPSPMEALVSSVRDTHLRPAQPARAARPSTALDSHLYAAASAVITKEPLERRRSLTGSASASASTSNENGSGNSSSASSLEQR